MDLTPTWLKAAGVSVPKRMEGRSLIPKLKGEKLPGRDFIFAERNWHDNWDPIRSVVGERYKLIQNYRSEVPYISSLDLINSPSYKEIQRLKSKNKLTGKLTWYAKDTRPPVEFYDLKNDPGEWHNLAGNPEYDLLITKYQKILGEWMNNTHDFLPPPWMPFLKVVD